MIGQRSASRIQTPSGKADSPAVVISAYLLYAKVLWRIAPLLMVCHAVSNMNRINISFTKLDMSTALGFSDGVFGLGVGIFL